MTLDRTYPVYDEARKTYAAKFATDPNLVEAYLIFEHTQHLN